MSDWVGRSWGCCSHCREQLLSGWLAPAESAHVWLDFVFLARSGRTRNGGLDCAGVGAGSLEARGYPFCPTRVLAAQLAAGVESAAEPHLLELHLLDEDGTLCDWSGDVRAPWADLFAVRSHRSPSAAPVGDDRPRAGG